MADLGKLREAAKAWATQEAQDIASGAKQPPMSSNEMAAAAKKASMPAHDHPVESDLHAGSLISQPYAGPDRGRALAQSVREGRSSVAKPAIKATMPETTSEVTTDTGEVAGATTAGPKFGGTRAAGFENRTPKDLGRVTTKVLRGGYGDISPKTASQVSESFASRAASSIRGLGETLGAYGAASLATKAASTYQGMKSGQSVNPLTLDTSPVQKGKKYLTVTGVKSGQELGAGDQM